MKRKISTLLCGMLVYSLLGSCSEEVESKCNPVCAAGQTCNESTGQCVTTDTCDEATDNSCLYKDKYCDGTSCEECPLGKYNCNGENDDACESSSKCDSGCDPGVDNSCRSTEEYCEAGKCEDCEGGKHNCNGENDDACESLIKCGPIKECEPTQKNSCSSEEKYCKDDTCEDCEEDKYNCNGLNDDACESDKVCTECDPAVDNSCGKVTEFCNNAGECETCLGDKYNCNGENGDNCESPTACTTTSGCLQECIEDNPKNCVKNTDGFCIECNDTSDCTKNPTSKGPVCNTDGLGAAGRNFCVCSASADCTSNPNGTVCQKEGPVVDEFKQCTCNEDSDCPTSNPVCHGKTYKWCEAKCTASEDCEKYGLYLCQTDVGKCMPMDM